MAAIEEKFAQAARDSGTALDERSLALAKASEQAKKYAEFTDLIADTRRGTEAQLRIAAAYDGTAASITRATNYEKAYAAAREKFDEKSPQFIGHVLDYAGALDRGSAAMRDLEQRQASVSALANSFSSAFDTIGNAITQAFVQGQGAAVNWGNVMKAVVSQVIQQYLRQAVINPLMNSLFGQNAGTLGVALSTLTGGGAPVEGSSGGFFSGGGALGTLGNAISVGRLFGGGGSGSGFGGIGSSIGNIWDYPVISPVFPGPTLSGAAGYTQPSLLGFGSGSGLSIGQAITGVSLGFGLGSMAGGYLQNAFGRTGPGPQIGSGLGAAVGTIFAGPAGCLVGGMIRSKPA
jgi:hypothetical protein